MIAYYQLPLLTIDVSAYICSTCVYQFSCNVLTIHFFKWLSLNIHLRSTNSIHRCFHQCLLLSSTIDKMWQLTTYKYQFINATLGWKCHHDQIKVLNATVVVVHLSISTDLANNTFEHYLYIDELFIKN